MRPPAINPRFGLQGPDRSYSPHQNMSRPQFPRPPPPFHKGTQHPRGNGNQNRHRRSHGPQGHMEGPGSQMMVPNRPMMCPNGPMPPMMIPCGPMMGPNGPMVPPGFMDPSSFNMMMRPMLPGAPMPKGAANGNILKPMEKGVQHSEENKPGQKEGACQNIASNNGDNGNYSYPQYPNFGWQGNTFPGGWNYNNPMNQFHPQNSGPQFGNNQTYYQTQDQSYNQYQNQLFVQGNYYDQQNRPYNNPNLNHNNWQNGGPTPGSKSPSKNNTKKKEMSQKMRMHYCDTCDKSFPSEEALATHLSEHKVCGLDDCKFKAHPKVVEKHQQMQHFSGLYRRIGSLYTPEDIEKWRQNRKKNYPTPQNVEERRAKQEEMYARGERIGGPNNRFSRRNQHQNGRQFQPRQHFRANGEKPENSSGPRPPPPASAAPPKKWKPVFPSVTFEIEESEERSGVRPFPGTAALKDTSAETQPDTTNASTSLSFLSMYGDSSSDEDDATEKSQNLEKNTEANGSSEPEPPTDNSSASPKPVSESPKLPPATSSEQTSLEEDSQCSNRMEESSNLHPVAVSEQTTLKDEDDTQCTNQMEDDDASSKPAPSPTQRKEVGSSEDQPKIEELDDTPNASFPGVTPSSCSKEHQATELETPVTKCVLDEASKSSENLSGANFPEKSIEDAASSTSKAVDDSDDSGPEEVPITRGIVPIGDQENSNDEEVEEVVKTGEGGRKRRRQPRQPPKRAKVEDEKPSNESQPQQQNRDDKRCETFNRFQRPHRPPIRRNPTLLEKLLSKEICHERNVILQCVRYVVENNFFRGDQSQTSKPGTS